MIQPLHFTNPSKLYSYHDKSERKATTEEKLQAGVGAIIGASAGLFYIAKRQNVKNPFKINYGLKQMCLMSFAPILGSVSVSMIGNDEHTNKRKLKEGVFQFTNAAIPTWLAGAALRLCETSKDFNNVPAKIVSVIAAILVGMHGAEDVANFV